MKVGTACDVCRRLWPDALVEEFAPSAALQLVLCPHCLARAMEVVREWAAAEQPKVVALEARIATLRRTAMPEA